MNDIRYVFTRYISVDDFQAVSLDEIKSHCRIVGDDDDTLLKLYHDSAVQHIENYISRPVLEQTVNAYFGSALSDARVIEEIVLDYGPYTPDIFPIFSNVRDAENNVVELKKIIDWTYTIEGKFCDLIIRFSKPRELKSFLITTNCGIFAKELNNSDPAFYYRLHHPIKAAALLIIAGLYEQRESVVPFNVAKNPTLTSLLNPYRRY